MVFAPAGGGAPGRSGGSADMVHDSGDPHLRGRKGDPAADTAGNGWMLHWRPGQGQPPELVRADPFGALAPVLSTSTAGHALVFCGYLFDLAADAVGGGCHADPARHLLSAYERDGLRCFEALRGGFIAALWDRALDRLFLVGDTMGLVPGYYAWPADGVWVGPSPKALAARRRPPSAVNRVLLAEWLLGRTNPSQLEETFFDGVRRLPPAHWRSFSASGSRSRRYWDPLPPGFTWLGDESVADVKAQLRLAVQRCLAAGADAVALSGGYDSLSIAALAASGTPADRRLHALSLRFAGTPLDEGERQQWAACRLGLPQTLHQDRGLAEEPDFLQRVLDDSARLPLPAQGLWQPLFTPLLAQARERGLTRILFGTGGDELFGVDAAFARDLLQGARLRELVRFVRARQRSTTLDAGRVARAILWSGAVGPQLQAAAARILGALRLPRPVLVPGDPGLVLDPEVRDLLARRAVEPGPAQDAPSLGHYSAALRRLVQCSPLMLDTEQRAAWTADHGITPLYPFFDRDLVALVLRLPPRLLYRDGYIKSPLRELAAQQLRGLARTNPKLDSGAMAVGVLSRGGERCWRALGGAQRLASLGVADPACAERIMQRFFHDGTGSPQLVWRLLSAEAWLRAGHGATA